MEIFPTGKQPLETDTLENKYLKQNKTWEIAKMNVGKKKKAFIIHIREEHKFEFDQNNFPLN